MSWSKETQKPIVMYVTSTDMDHPDYFRKVAERHGYEMERCYTMNEALAELATLKAQDRLPVALVTPASIYADKDRSSSGVGAELIHHVKDRYPEVFTVGFTMSADKPYIRQPDSSYKTPDARGKLQPAAPPDYDIILPTIGGTEHRRSTSPRKFMKAKAELVYPADANIQLYRDHRPDPADAIQGLFTMLDELLAQHKKAMGSGRKTGGGHGR